LLQHSPTTNTATRYAASTYEKSGRHDLNVRPLRPEKRGFSFNYGGNRVEKYGKTGEVLVFPP